MQMCHGKRKCALSADQATFGSPCKPESRMYLKVIHTCGKCLYLSTWLIFFLRLQYSHIRYGQLSRVGCHHI